MREGLTKQERIAIVNEAIRLIKEPITFIQGYWKCPIWKKKGTGELMALLSDLTPAGCVQARDDEGEPLFAYCVEGAVNQAGLNILGPDRARHFGASSGIFRNGEEYPAEDPNFAQYLSINELAKVMFAELGVGMYAAARYVNDSNQGGTDAELKEGKELAHRRIMKLLRKRAAALQAE